MLRRVDKTVVAVEKQLVLHISVCVCVVLVIQHAKRVRRIILSSVAWLAVPFFSHYVINGTNFGNKLLNIKCVF